MELKRCSSSSEVENLVDAVLESLWEIECLEDDKMMEEADTMLGWLN